MRLYTATIDALDVPALAAWWARALHWQVVFSSEDEAAVVPPHAEPGGVDDRDDFDRVGAGLCFVQVPEHKQVKNRVHLDFAPHATESQTAIVERLVSLGATHVDVGQGDDATWVVLADPEGNEFCILSARRE